MPTPSLPPPAWPTLGLVALALCAAPGAGARERAPDAPPRASGPPSCQALATDPAAGLEGTAGVSALSARIVPVGVGVVRAYCQVEFTYDSGRSGPKDGYAPGQHQAIGLRVGLPLRADDTGAAGSSSGGWNGKIHNLGSGGCMGDLPAVTAATNAGYAGATSNGGHTAPFVGFNCKFGVIQDQHALNAGSIRDFTGEHVRWQTVWSKRLTQTYYGRPPERTYFTGCSQGGREAHIALQTLPEEYDGILGGGSALYWMPFQVAQSWSGLVIKDMLRIKGETLSPEQISSTVDAEIASCDRNDGVADGVIADPRTCRWSARAAVCGVKGAPAKACLDADQARAFDTIRAGPHNRRGELLWFPWEPGTVFSPNTNYLLSDGVMQWAVRDTGFRSDAHLYMDAAHLNAAHDPQGITYEDMAALASRTASDLADADAMPARTLDPARLKFISWTGTSDRNIPSRNSIRYDRELAHHLGTDVRGDGLRSWYRLFLYPGVDHCGRGDGPQPGDVHTGPLFDALVAWVEHGEAPRQIIATRYEGQSRPPVPGAFAGPPPPIPSVHAVATRPVCPYPHTAAYRGGDPNAAASFVCRGDLETPSVVARDRLARHKAENGGRAVPSPYGG